MYRIWFILVCFSIGFIHCAVSKPRPNGKELNPEIQTKAYIPDTIGKVANVVFDSSTYHFGEVLEGEKVYREIYFTNTGPGDLVIELITACECTKLDWPRLPVRVGQRAKIKIEYNSKDKSGDQIVDVDIIANTEPIVSSAKFKIHVKK